MNLSQEKNIDFSSLDPSITYNYLQSKGWQEESRIDERAVILSNHTQGKTFQILLPLNRDIPDFASRMYDVIKVLQTVENRPAYEIHQILEDPKDFAIIHEREILSLKFKFVYNQNQQELSAKNMGLVLSSLQDLFHAVGQFESGKPDSFKIPREISEKTELFVFETFKGSFGVKLALAPKEQQLDLLQAPMSERVSARFLNLIKYSNEADKAILRDLLLEIKRRAASRYRKFLVQLVSTGANFDVRWGSANPQGGGHAFLSYENTVNTVDFINKMEEEEPEEYTVSGELISASKSRNTLEIENLQDRKKYLGDIPDSVINSSGVELTIGRYYSAIFREITSINPATGEEKNERTVISISSLDEGAEETISQPIGEVAVD